MCGTQLCPELYFVFGWIPCSFAPKKSGKSFLNKKMSLVYFVKHGISIVRVFVPKIIFRGTILSSGLRESKDPKLRTIKFSATYLAASWTRRL